MQKKLVAIFTLLLVFAMIPGMAYAVDADGDGYHDVDFQKLQAFLNQPSAVPGKTNGEVLNSSYDPDKPSTWSDVFWSSGEPPQRVTRISWYRNDITGTLDLSGLTALKYFTAYSAQLTAIDVSGCTSLTEFEYTGPFFGERTLTSLNLRGATALERLSLANTLLTSLDLSDATELTFLYIDNSELTSLDLSKLTRLTEIQCINDNPLTRLEATIQGHSVTLTADGIGTVGLWYRQNVGDYYARASTDGFINWTDETGAVVTIQSICQLEEGRDYNLTANFSRVYVRFDTLGGSGLEPIIATRGSNISPPPEPTRTGHTFAGWYKDEALTEPWDFENDVVTGEMVLFAKWDLNSYTVSFDSRGGSAVESITAYYNSTIIAPQDPVREGYIFTGWFKDEDLADPWDFENDRVTEDITLYAGWKEVVPEEPEEEEPGQELPKTGSRSSHLP